MRGRVPRAAQDSGQGARPPGPRSRDRGRRLPGPGHPARDRSPRRHPVPRPDDVAELAHLPRRVRPLPRQGRRRLTRGAGRGRGESIWCARHAPPCCWWASWGPWPGGTGRFRRPTPPTSPPFRPRRWPAGEGPAVLIDDAHWNGATGERGLAGFTTLLRADGYELLPAGNATRAEMLADARIAVVADPLGLSGWLRGLAARLGLPPLTALDDDALWVQEMETVVQWVENGGSLLIAVDEGPPARGVRGLAVRLGIDLHEGVDRGPRPLGAAQPRAAGLLARERAARRPPDCRRLADRAGGQPGGERRRHRAHAAGRGGRPAAAQPVGGRGARASATRRPRAGRRRGWPGPPPSPAAAAASWSSPTPRWLRRCSTPTARRSGWVRRGTNNDRFARYVMRWLARAEG